jgi:redox-sensitive bicupin YhaK (pirin superfamily)
MITIRRGDDRGRSDLGWLDSRHTFSFADYRDPAHMGFSVLRVINEDRVKPGKGFGTHGHRDMEIISWVLDGALQHQDSLGNGSIIRPGELQLMTAGTGVLHSEFNGSASEPLHFLQIWILPDRTGLPPAYEQKSFPEEERVGRWRLMLSPDGRDGSVIIHQDASLSAASSPRGRKP